MKKSGLVCSICLFSLLFFSSSIHGQGSWLAFGGAEFMPDQFPLKRHHKVFGAGYQHKLANRFFVGADMSYKISAFEIADEFGFDTAVTGFGLGRGQGRITVFKHGSGPAVAMSDKIINNMQMEVPIYAAIKLGRAEQIPLLLKLGLTNNILQHFEFNLDEPVRKSFVYTNGLLFGLQIPAFRSESFGLSLAPYLSLIQGVDQGNIVHFPVEELSRESWFGLRLQAHFF